MIRYELRGYGIRATIRVEDKDGQGRGFDCVIDSNS